MVFKKFDRAFQRAGELMGTDANKTNYSEEFEQLKTEMGLRHAGMVRLHRSTNTFVKTNFRRGDTFDDGQKGYPENYLGRTMIGHGEEFDSDSTFGKTLILFGRTEERLAVTKENFQKMATEWLASLARSLAMMDEYEAARKKLENRRVGFDASNSKMQKARRDDYRVEEELRTARAKFEESTEDVTRRMQDIRESESESVRDMTAFLDAELEYHERCVEELRRLKAGLPAEALANSPDLRESLGRSRSSSTVSSMFVDRGSKKQSTQAEEDAAESVHLQVPPKIQSGRHYSRQLPEIPKPPPIQRASTYQAPTSRFDDAQRFPIAGTPTPLAGIAALRGHRLADDSSNSPTGTLASGRSGSPEWGDDRSAPSPATSVSSLRSAIEGRGGIEGRKAAPPPPPPSRAKKPAPPIPAKRDAAVY